jgi:DNA-binding PadR family transcriptional regulator
MSDNKDMHGFSVSVAIEIGAHRAIMLQHFRYLQISFSDTDKDPKEVWIKRSRKALTDTYPYMTEKEIRGCLDRLDRDDYIRSKVDNALNYDRTKSYQLSKKGWELAGDPPSDKRANRDKKASDKRANGIDKRANDNVTKGPMNIGSYSSVVTSIVGCENAPAPAESETLKAEEVKRGMYAPPAEAAAPTHLVKTTGPDSNGVIEAEGITLAAITYDQYPKPKNSQELKESMRRYFVANPKEWKDGVLEQSHATNWTAEKIGDCMTAFCAHQEAEGNLKRTYGQYKGMLVKWFLSQPSFDRTKPMPGASSTQSNSPVPTNIRRL